MEKVRKILMETFHLKTEDIVPELSMEDVDTWDSLAHMEMIANLESEFGIEFDGDEIVEMTTVAKIEKKIKEKINGLNE